MGERDRYLEIRLRATEGSQMSIYFTTPTGSWSEARRLSFDIVADGQFRDYWVDLYAASSAWRGPITQFRLDLEPPGAEGAVVEIQAIRFWRVGPALDLADALSTGTIYQVRIEGTSIPEQPFYGLYEQAWVYTPDGYLIVKVSHAGRTRVEARF